MGCIILHANPDPRLLKKLVFSRDVCGVIDRTPNKTRTALKLMLISGYHAFTGLCVFLLGRGKELYFSTIAVTQENKRIKIIVIELIANSSNRRTFLSHSKASLWEHLSIEINLSILKLETDIEKAYWNQWRQSMQQQDKEWGDRCNFHDQVRREPARALGL